MSSYIKATFVSHINVFIFILISLAIQFLALLVKELSLRDKSLHEEILELKEINANLQIYKDKLNKSMENIMSLYRVVEAFNSQDESKMIFNTFASYAKQLTESKNVFFSLKPDSESDDILIFTPNKSDEITHLKESLLVRWEEYECAKGPTSLHKDNKEYLIFPVSSTSKCYGLMGIEGEWSHSEVDSNILRQLYFLADFAAIVMERIFLEEVADKLLLSEEQNRIANEIHDNVSHRLFNVQYGIYALKKNWKNISKEKVQEQLDLISDSANVAVTELRSSIYRLSSKKAEPIFIKNLKTYLDGYAKLHEINVDLCMKGQDEYLSNSYKKALIRIIRESTGNAARHGHCQNVWIYLDINVQTLNLIVADDGDGFVIQSNENRVQGLGLRNIQNLVKLLDGTFALQTCLKQGTEISITIPIDYKKVS